MSKIKNNPLLKGISGMFANQIVFREVRGHVVMSNRPKKKETLTPHQLRTKEKFLKGVHYAKAQMKDPVAKALYAAAITESKFHAYMVALTDYLTPPVIHETDSSGYTGTPGNVITTRVTDDFRVESVQLTIADPDGVVVEQGNAKLVTDTQDMWEYVATVSNVLVRGSKLIVSAKDRAGNVTTSEKVF